MIEVFRDGSAVDTRFMDCRSLSPRLGTVGHANALPACNMRRKAKVCVKSEMLFKSIPARFFFLSCIKKKYEWRGPSAREAFDRFRLYHVFLRKI